jgi:hypothetical protein
MIIIPENVTTATASPMAGREQRGKPKIFDGNYTESRGFLTTMQRYLMLEKVRDQSSRVITTLNYIRGERVDSWAISKTFWSVTVSKDPALLQGQDAWSVFKEDFLREFAYPMESAKAQKEIEEVKMEGVELDAYIQNFRELACKAQYDQNAPYTIHLFLQGLPADLVRCCFDREELTSFEDWVNATRKYRLKYRLILNTLIAPPLSNEEALLLRQAQATAAPSTMDVHSQQRALTEEDNIWNKREGRCFHCHQQGHISKMHPQNGETATGRPNTNERRERQSCLTSAERTWLQIRAFANRGKESTRRMCPTVFWNRNQISSSTSPLRTGIIVVDE